MSEPWPTISSSLGFDASSGGGQSASLDRKNKYYNFVRRFKENNGKVDLKLKTHSFFIVSSPAEPSLGEALKRHVYHVSQQLSCLDIGPKSHLRHASPEGVVDAVNKCALFLLVLTPQMLELINGEGVHAGKIRGGLSTETDVALLAIRAALVFMTRSLVVFDDPETSADDDATVYKRLATGCKLPDVKRWLAERLDQRETMRFKAAKPPYASLIHDILLNCDDTFIKCETLLRAQRDVSSPLDDVELAEDWQKSIQLLVYVRPLDDDDGDEATAPAAAAAAAAASKFDVKVTYFVPTSTPEATRAGQMPFRCGTLGALPRLSTAQIKSEKRLAAYAQELWGLLGKAWDEELKAEFAGNHKSATAKLLLAYGQNRPSLAQKSGDGNTPLCLKVLESIEKAAPKKPTTWQIERETLGGHASKRDATTCLLDWRQEEFYRWYAVLAWFTRQQKKKANGANESEPPNGMITGDAGGLTVTVQPYSIYVPFPRSGIFTTDGSLAWYQQPSSVKESLEQLGKRLEMTAANANGPVRFVVSRDVFGSAAGAELIKSEGYLPHEQVCDELHGWSTQPNRSQEDRVDATRLQHVLNYLCSEVCGRSRRIRSQLKPQVIFMPLVCDFANLSWGAGRFLSRYREWRVFENGDADVDAITNERIARILGKNEASAAHEYAFYISRDTRNASAEHAASDLAKLLKMRGYKKVRMMQPLDDKETLIYNVGGSAIFVVIVTEGVFSAPNVPLEIRVAMRCPNNTILCVAPDGKQKARKLIDNAEFWFTRHERWATDFRQADLVEIHTGHLFLQQVAIDQILQSADDGLRAYKDSASIGDVCPPVPVLLNPVAANKIVNYDRHASVYVDLGTGQSVFRVYCLDTSGHVLIKTFKEYTKDSKKWGAENVEKGPLHEREWTDELARSVTEAFESAENEVRKMRVRRDTNVRRRDITIRQVTVGATAWYRKWATEEEEEINRGGSSGQNEDAPEEEPKHPLIKHIEQCAIDAKLVGEGCATFEFVRLEGCIEALFEFVAIKNAIRNQKVVGLRDDDDDDDDDGKMVRGGASNNNTRGFDAVAAGGRGSLQISIERCYASLQIGTNEGEELVKRGRHEEWQDKVRTLLAGDDAKTTTKELKEQLDVIRNSMTTTRKHQGSLKIVCISGLFYCACDCEIINRKEPPKWLELASVQRQCDAVVAAPPTDKKDDALVRANAIRLLGVLDFLTSKNATNVNVLFVREWDFQKEGDVKFPYLATWSTGSFIQRIQEQYYELDRFPHVQTETAHANTVDAVVVVVAQNCGGKKCASWISLWEDRFDVLVAFDSKTMPDVASGIQDALDRHGCAYVTSDAFDERRAKTSRSAEQALEAFESKSGFGRIVALVSMCASFWLVCHEGCFEKDATVLAYRAARRLGKKIVLIQLRLAEQSQCGRDATIAELVANAPEDIAKGLLQKDVSLFLTLEMTGSKRRHERQVGTSSLKDPMIEARVRSADKTASKFQHVLNTQPEIRIRNDHEYLAIASSLNAVVQHANLHRRDENGSSTNQQQSQKEEVRRRCDDVLVRFKTRLFQSLWSFTDADADFKSRLAILLSVELSAAAVWLLRANNAATINPSYETTVLDCVSGLLSDDATSSSIGDECVSEAPAAKQRRKDAYDLVAAVVRTSRTLQAPALTRVLQELPRADDRHDIFRRFLEYDVDRTDDETTRGDQVVSKDADVNLSDFVRELVVLELGPADAERIAAALRGKLDGLLLLEDAAPTVRRLQRKTEGFLTECKEIKANCREIAKCFLLLLIEEEMEFGPSRTKHCLWRLLVEDPNSTDAVDILIRAFPRLGSQALQYALTLNKHTIARQILQRNPGIKSVTPDLRRKLINLANNNLRGPVAADSEINDVLVQLAARDRVLATTILATMLSHSLWHRATQIFKLFEIMEQSTTTNGLRASTAAPEEGGGSTPLPTTTTKSTSLVTQAVRKVLLEESTEGSGGTVWHDEICASDEPDRELLARYLCRHAPDLVDVCDGEGRTAMSRATARVRRELEDETYFCGKFQLLSRAPEHQSQSCVILRAKDQREGKKNREVIIKLMDDLDQFHRECGHRMGLDHSFVIDILHSSDQEEDDRWKKDAEKFGFEQFSRCGFVMEAAQRNMFVALVQERNDLRSLQDMLRSIATCIKHLHTRGQLIHADIKPLNCVRMLDGTWRLIDLDASCRINSAVGWKLSTAYCPPEMTYTEHNRVQFILPKCESDAAGSAEQSSSKIGREPLKAERSFDAWSFGCLMYRVLSRQPLFVADDRDNLRDEWEERRLREWNPDDIDRAVHACAKAIDADICHNIGLGTTEAATVGVRAHALACSTAVADLLAWLLQQDPNKRASNFAHVLQHPALDARLLVPSDFEKAMRHGTWKMSTLHVATHLGDVDRVEKALATVPVHNSDHPLLRTPVHVAVATGNLKVLSVLLEAAGAPGDASLQQALDATDSGGRTPLEVGMFAIEFATNTDEDIENLANCIDVLLAKRKPDLDARVVGDRSLYQLGVASRSERVRSLFKDAKQEEQHERRSAEFRNIIKSHNTLSRPEESTDGSPDAASQNAWWRDDTPEGLRVWLLRRLENDNKDPDKHYDVYQWWTDIQQIGPLTDNIKRAEMLEKYRKHAVKVANMMCVDLGLTGARLLDQFMKKFRLKKSGGSSQESRSLEIDRDLLHDKLRTAALRRATPADEILQPPDNLLTSSSKKSLKWRLTVEFLNCLLHVPGLTFYKLLMMASLPTDRCPLEDYEWIECVGHGSFGEVHKCKHRYTKRPHCLKIVWPSHFDDDDDKIHGADPGGPHERALEETRNQQLMAESKYVVKMLTWMIVASKFLVVIMEFGTGGTLSKYCRDPTTSRRKLKRRVCQLARGLAELEENKVIHRDIKPDNLLVSTDETSNETVKFIDFGLATSYRVTERLPRDARTGSIPFMAPEVVSYRPSKQDALEKRPDAFQAAYTTKADVWSMGITFLQLIVGEKARRDVWKRWFAWFDSDDARRSPPQNKVAAQDKDVAVWKKELSRWFNTDLDAHQGFLEECARLLSRVLQIDDEKRPTASELLVFIDNELKWTQEEEEEEGEAANDEKDAVPLTLQPPNNSSSVSHDCKKSSRDASGSAATAITTSVPPHRQETSADPSIWSTDPPKETPPPYVESAKSREHKQQQQQQRQQHEGSDDKNAAPDLPAMSLEVASNPTSKSGGRFSTTQPHQHATSTVEVEKDEPVSLPLPIESQSSKQQHRFLVCDCGWDSTDAVVCARRGLRGVDVTRLESISMRLLDRETTEIFRVLEWLRGVRASIAQPRQQQEKITVVLGVTTVKQDDLVERMVLETLRQTCPGSWTAIFLSTQQVVRYEARALRHAWSSTRQTGRFAAIVGVGYSGTNVALGPATTMVFGSSSQSKGGSTTNLRSRALVVSRTRPKSASETRPKSAVGSETYLVVPIGVRDGVRVLELGTAKVLGSQGREGVEMAVHRAHAECLQLCEFVLTQWKLKYKVSQCHFGDERPVILTKDCARAARDAGLDVWSGARATSYTAGAVKARLHAAMLGTLTKYLQACLDGTDADRAAQARDLATFTLVRSILDKIFKDGTRLIFAADQWRLASCDFELSWVSGWFLDHHCCQQKPPVVTRPMTTLLRQESSEQSALLRDFKLSARRPSPYLRPPNRSALTR